jgi:hypothetical protein
MNKISIFFLGIITALSALILEFIPSTINPIFFKFDFSNFSYALIIFVFIEEFLKLAVIWKISQSLVTKKIFINSGLFGIGFGMTEIILNTFNQSTFLFLPYLNLALLHIFTSLLFGYGFSQKYTKIKMILIFLLANCFHFFYNLNVLYNFNSKTTVIISSIFIIFLIFKIFLPSKEN